MRLKVSIQIVNKLARNSIMNYIGWVYGYILIYKWDLALIKCTDIVFNYNYFA